MSNNKNFYWILENKKWTKSNELKENNSLVYLGNNEEDSDLDNLIDLIHLNEPSILYSSLVRYKKDKIYTFTGNILLAINPFKKIDMYGLEWINKFRKGLNEMVEPHPYYISQNCLTNLFKNDRNQVVLVSGESGAGKTVTTKFIMKYISQVADKSVENLENKILASNPIIEAFGNAKTLRNDNSSRFGKFIKLLFNEEKLVGAKIESYLLEKIRLTSLGKGERNFHIFYLLLSCHPNYSGKIEDFNLLNRSNVNQRADGVTDLEQYEELISSFKNLNFSDLEIDNIFKFSYFILNLGNCSNGDLNNMDKELSSSLDFDLELFQNYLEINKIKVGTEIIEKHRDEKEKRVVLETVCQNLYLLLFNFIINKINYNINTSYDKYIGILDIFGFEVFKKNNFEQLCINYTNERLQNIFNKFIFELEQKEYKREGIEWEDIPFSSNNQIINLIDYGKGGSLFSCLIEQSILGSGNDGAFYQNIVSGLNNRNNFIIKNKDKVQKRFRIEHYAGEVTYDTIGYVNKNRNNVDMRLKKLIENSNNSLLSAFDLSIFSFVTGKIKKKNIIYQFKGQLDKLVKELSSQEQHYIRCIKPNDENICNKFCEERVLEQLKYCGVLEAIKIARLGYPVRIQKDTFYNKFYSLFRKNGVDECFDMFELMEYEKDLYKIGNGKIFLKKEMNNILINDNEKVRDDCAVLIQKSFRMFYKRKSFKILLRFLRRLVIKVRRYYKKKVYAVTLIILFFKRCKYRLRYLSILGRVIYIQRFWRDYRFKMKKDCLEKINEICKRECLRNSFKKWIEIVNEDRNSEVITKFFKRIVKNKKSAELNDRVNLLKEIEELKSVMQNVKMSGMGGSLNGSSWRDKYERIKEDYTAYKKEMRDYMEKFREVETNECGNQCDLLLSSDLNVLKYENESVKEENRRLISKNSMMKVDMSNKNKIILNLSAKVDELSEYKKMAKVKISQFERDQEILGDKMMNLYLKIDYYEEMLKIKRDKKGKRFLF